jgi:N-acetylglucosaminyldiphosphoundecaprenol N-acetyl-beta-D-mannosaminyltransferase
MKSALWEPVLGVDLWWGSKKEALEIISGWIKRSEKRKQIATVNPEFVMQAVGDPTFNKLLKNVDLKVVDGVGLVWARQVAASKEQRMIACLQEGLRVLRGNEKEGLVPGVELAQALIELAAKNDWRVMLVGGWGDRAQRSAANFVKKWPKLKIKAIEGEPTMSHKDTLRHINDYSPAVLLVAYGMRKQEEWVQENKDRLDFGVAVGVGRSFDYWSGELKRAPAGVRKMGLEWLYSLYKEPKRWRRQLALLEFVKKVVYK